MHVERGGYVLVSLVALVVLGYIASEFLQG